MPGDNWESYVNDPRTICKYGAKCYQKNPEHHKTYKHPPKHSRNVKNAQEKRRFSPYERRNDTNRTAEDSHLSDTKQNNSQNTEKTSTEQIMNTNEVVTDAHQSVIIPDNIDYYDKDDYTILKDLFLVDMPIDFFKFFECFNNKDNSIEKTLATVNLELVGPCDIFLGKLPKLEEKDLYLVHWRYFYDPPEFQTIIKKKGNSQYHMGYYRDSPSERPVFVASNDSSKDCRLIPMAENIFGAVYMYLQNEKKNSPFTSMACQKLMEQIKVFAEKNSFTLEEYSMKKRHAQTVAKTLHGAGIVVPYNKKTQLGYRHLTETDANIKKMFSKLENAKDQSEKDKVLSDLQPVITYANIAVDECDFGTGLEVGIDFFCSGLKELESSALNSLTSAYTLLNREAFKKIITVHMKYRRKGSKLSVLDFK